MNVTFIRDRHIYTVDSYIVGGTTRVMRSNGLLDYMPDAPAAMEAGQNKHSAIHYFLEGDLDESTCTPEQLSVCKAAVACLVSLGYTPEDGEAECLIGSNVHWYATQIDWLSNDGETLINWKTGGAWKHYPIQLHLEAALLPKSPRRILAVYLTGEEKTPYRIVEHTRDLSAYRVAMALAAASGAAMQWKIANGLAEKLAA